MTHSFTLYVDGARLKWLSMNDRLHYRARADRTRAWIHATDKALKGMDVPHMERCHIEGRIYKNRNTRYDPHNLYATLKPIIDAIVRHGGIIDDDDYTRVSTGLEHGGIDKTQLPHITVTITEVTA